MIFSEQEAAAEAGSEYYLRASARYQLLAAADEKMLGRHIEHRDYVRRLRSEMDRGLPNLCLALASRLRHLWPVHSVVARLADVPEAPVGAAIGALRYRALVDNELDDEGSAAVGRVCEVDAETAATDLVELSIVTRIMRDLDMCAVLGPDAEDAVDMLPPPFEACAHLEQAFAAIERAGCDATSRFVQSNLRLVVMAAKRYQGRGLPLDDLIQEGNIGLMDAVGRYNYRQGFRFSTYGMWWIRKSMLAAIGDQSRVVRVPRSVHQEITRLERARQDLTQEQGREVSTAEMLAHHAEHPDRLRAAVLATGRMSSLDVPVGENGDATFGDLFADTAAVVPVEASMSSGMHRDIMAAMTRLTHREREVLIQYFGIGGDVGRSLSDIGAEQGVTRERIRQIKEQALKKLRRSHSASHLRDYLG